MNLVAKEFLAARHDEDGVLVLSIFTGAASELKDALQVNPYDISEVAETVHQGLEMVRSERRSRMQRMRRYIMDHNVYRWAATILSDLHELRMEGAGGMEFNRPGPISVPPPDAKHVKLVEKARLG
jgi:trehalose 6-phosphate synthase